MKIREFAAVAALFLLAGCQTAHEQLVWARKDGQRMADNPTLAAQGTSDQIQCKAQASQAAGQVNMPTSVAIGRGAFSGFGESRQASMQNRISDNTMEACMDLKGYSLVPLPKRQSFIPLRS